MSGNPFAEPSGADNPYRPPASFAPLAATPDKSGEIVRFRQGKRLVVGKVGTFPPICPITNEPTDRTLKRRMTWHHPAVYLAILPGFLVYIILAMILQQKATLVVPMARRVLRRRAIVMTIAWLGILASAAALFGACVVDRGPPVWGPTLGIGGLIALAIFAVFGAIGSRTVWPAKIDEHFVWLKGVSPDYLATLPEFPYAV